MSKQLTAPADEARNELIPLPVSAPHETWQEAAAAIAHLYEAQRPKTFPECGTRSALADSAAIAHLLHAIDSGLTTAQAAKIIGLKPSTLRTWAERAEREPESAFAAFTEAAERAREGRRQRLLQTVENASLRGPQYWPAAAWSLERGYGNDYKLNQDKQAAQVVVNVGVFNAGDIQLGRGESGPHNTLPDIVIPTKPVDSTT